MADAVGIDKEKPNRPLTVAVKMLKGGCGLTVEADVLPLPPNPNLSLTLT